MRGLLALVWREISERRALLAAAAVASLLPVLAPLLPSTGSNPAADTREMVMWVMVGLLVPIFALLLGVSFVGRDLSEGRLGFYFAQPLSGPTIWFGKLTAVALLVWGAQVLIMLPTVLLSGDSTRLLLLTGLEDGIGYVSLVWRLGGPALWLVPLGIVLLAHAVSVVWRGRSAWLVVDLIALTAAAAGVWWAIRPFLPWPAPDSLSEWLVSRWWGVRLLSSSDAPMTALAGVLGLVGAGYVSLIVAGAVQMTSGRVDPKRAHRSLSAALWSVLGVAVAGLLGWSGWVRAATPADLLRVEHVSVASGDWVAVSGPSRGRLDYRPRFVVNAVGGSWARTGPAPQHYWYGSDSWFSGDGLHFFWTTVSAGAGQTLMVVDLDGPELEPRRVGLAIGGRRSRIAVSQHGERVAIIDHPTIAVYDVATGDQLAAVAITGGFSPDYCWFEDPNTLVIAASREWVREDVLRSRYKSTTYRFDVASRTLTGGDVVEDRQIPEEPQTEKTVVARNQRYLDFVDRDEGERLILVDVSTEEPIADLGDAGQYQGERELGDGRFLVLRVLDRRGFMDCFDADGVRLARIELGRCDSLDFGGEIVPGRLMVGCKDWESVVPRVVTYQTSIVDMSSVRVLTTIDGYYPLQATRRSYNGVEATPGAWQPGSVSSRLLLGDDESLRVWEPDAGKANPVAPAVG